MPYVEMVTTKSINETQKKALSGAFGQMIEVFPGKTEKWLMVSVRGDAFMTFAGEPGDAAMVTISLFGRGDAQAYARMTDGVCRLLSDTLGLPPERIYIKYEEIAHWGWNGGNF